MIIENLIKAKNGNTNAIEEIIKHYDKYIYFLINKYQIQDQEECYDFVIEKVWKSIDKFEINSTF